MSEFQEILDLLPRLKMNKIPNIGEVVSRPSGDDWVCQARLGEEQFVLVWGLNRERFVIGDVWESRG
jgi:hypothetical protein